MFKPLKTQEPLYPQYAEINRSIDAFCTRLFSIDFQSTLPELNFSSYNYSGSHAAGREKFLEDAKSFTSFVENLGNVDLIEQNKLRVLFNTINGILTTYGSSFDTTNLDEQVYIAFMEVCFNITRVINSQLGRIQY